MKTYLALLQIILCVPIYSAPGFDGVEGSKENYKLIGDDHIRIALGLNKKGKYDAALDLLRSGIEKTDFTNIKIRYFTAKQYVLIMEKSESARKNPDFQKNLRYHFKAVENYIRSSSATPQEVKYYTPGLKAIAKTGLLSTHSNLPQHLGFKSLQAAAARARNRWPSYPGKCYPVIVLTAKNNGARGDGWSWGETKKYRWSPISAVQKAIWSGTLRPGMVVYANTSPGADPSSLNMRYLPHWFTYLGKDQHGIDRFGDQYSANATLRDIENLIPGRVIDSFLDPYGRI